MSRIVKPAPERGQALVEFSLAIMVFLALVIGIFDIGRGIYVYNGVAEAAREIARITSTHVGDPVGTSQETVDRVAVQRALTPGMTAPVIACEDLYGAAGTCKSGDYVKVVVTAPYQPISFLGLPPVTLSSASSVQIP
jgi:Flp pilus assembly protein CpaB